MKEIGEIIFSKFEKRNFETVIKSADWVELPLLYKLIALNEFEEIFSVFDFDKWSKYKEDHLDLYNTEFRSNILQFKIEAIEFHLGLFGNSNFKIKKAILLKEQEIYVKFKFLDKDFIDKQSILLLDQYIADKLEILKEQEINPIYDDSEIEKLDIKQFNDLKKDFHIGHAQYEILLQDIHQFSEKDVANYFFQIFFRLHNFDKSHIDNFVPFSFSEVKLKFKELKTKSSLTNSTINFLIDNLLTLKDEAIQKIYFQKFVLKELEPERYIAGNILNRNISYFERLLLVINEFNEFLKENYLGRRPKASQYNHIKEIITDNKRFRQIVFLLHEKGYLKKILKNEYQWISDSPKFVMLVIKLDTLDLFNPKLQNRYYSIYGQLLAVFFHFNPSLRSLQKSNVYLGDDLFNFLNDC